CACSIAIARLRACIQHLSGVYRRSLASLRQSPCLGASKSLWISPEILPSYGLRSSLIPSPGACHGAEEGRVLDPRVIGMGSLEFDESLFSLAIVASGERRHGEAECLPRE